MPEMHISILPLISVRTPRLHMKMKCLNEQWLITVWLNEPLFIAGVEVCRAVCLLGAKTPQ